MDERILVPLDGSEVGEAILPKIEDLVLRTIPKNELEVILIQVISKINFNFLTEDSYAQIPYSESEVQRLTNEAQEYLNKVAGIMKSKGFIVKTMVAFGRAAEEIVKAAHETNSNLIAMSTHNRISVLRWTLGSVTNDVIRLSEKIPVFAIKASNKEQRTSTLAMGSLQSLVKSS